MSQIKLWQAERRKKRQNKRLLTFPNTYEIESTSQAALSVIVQKAQLTTRGHCILLMHEFANLLPTPNPAAKVLLPCGCFTYPRTPSSTLLIYHQYKFFHNELHLSSLNLSYERVPIQTLGQQTYLSSPSSPAAGSLGCMAQDLVLFLANM